MIKFVLILSIYYKPVLMKRVENEVFQSLSENIIDHKNYTKSNPPKPNTNNNINESFGKHQYFFNRNFSEEYPINKTLQPTTTAGYKHKKYIINYQQVYGLRYSPTIGVKHADLPEEEISTSAATLLMSTQSMPRNQTEIVTTPQHGGNIMRPESSTTRVNAAVDLIKNRVQNLISFAMNNTTKEHQIMEEVLTPTKRFLSLFSIIQFHNGPCLTGPVPLRKLQGTCYHKLECAELGGTAIGSCIAGFAVCCVFRSQCGQTTQQNVTYFENPGFPLPIKENLSCTLTVMILPGVKQILVEFLIFEMGAPTNGTCIDDQFVIAGHSMNQYIPIICGINTGQHIIVDVENAFEGKIFLSALSMIPGIRLFSIRVTQIRGDFAPQHCLQYHKQEMGYVQTFNYDDISTVVQVRRPGYFNNMNYAICIKRLPGYCTITYSNEIQDMTYDFQLQNLDDDGLMVVPEGQAGAEVFNCGDDYISVNGIRLCGERLNDGSVTEDFTKNAPVTDFTAGPIILHFRTNEMDTGRGFKLLFRQNLCGQTTLI